MEVSPKQDVTRRGRRDRLREQTTAQHEDGGGGGWRLLCRLLRKKKRFKDFFFFMLPAPPVLVHALAGTETWCKKPAGKTGGSNQLITPETREEIQ